MFRSRRDAVLEYGSTEIETAGDRVLADPVLQEAEPYATPPDVLMLAGLLALVGVFQSRSRVRGKSFLLILLLGVAYAATQMRFAMRTLVVAGAEEVGEVLYGYLPWLAGGATILACLLLLVPKRRLITR